MGCPGNGHILFLNGMVALNLLRVIMAVALPFHSFLPLNISQHCREALSLFPTVKFIHPEEHLFFINARRKFPVASKNG